MRTKIIGAPAGIPVQWDTPAGLPARVTFRNITPSIPCSIFVQHVTLIRTPVLHQRFIWVILTEEASK